jgi:hypothetical protein
MTRALRALVVTSCAFAFAACPGTNWQAALDGYTMRIPVPDASVGFVNGRNCGANFDCLSGQCRNGLCIEDVPVGNGPVSCGDDDDCGSESRDGGRVCEPNSVSGAYACATFMSCGKTGRVCREASDCFSPTGGCGSGCIDGICKVLTCGREESGSTCAVQSDCCSGYFCSGPVDGGVIEPGTGRCLTSAANILPENALCTASDQCISKFCSTGVPRTCTNVSGAKLGDSCGGAVMCLSGLVCENSRCLIAEPRGCVLDSSCRSGQCLAGFCTSKTDSITQARVCRQLNLVCGDDNDCCTGLCDAEEKQCTLTPKLANGDSCTVDPITQHCGSPDAGTVTCVGAYGVCGGGEPCCNGMTCTNGTCF